MLSALHWWEQFTRELLWVWEEQARTLVKSRQNPIFWLANQTRILRVQEYASRDLRFTETYRENLARSWFNLALSLGTRVALRKIKTLRIQWLQYWSRRPRTHSGARATTKLEAFETFSINHNRRA